MSKEYIVNCREITTRKGFHKQIAEIMDFPEYYGNNLDALSDVLTDIGEETLLILEESSKLQENLPPYYEKIVKVLNYVQEENPNFKYELR